MSRVASINMSDSEYEALAAAADVAQTTISGVIRDSLRRTGFKMARRPGDPEPSREQRVAELKARGDPTFVCDGCGLEYAATTATRHVRGGATSRYMRIGGKTLCEECAPRYRRREVEYVPTVHSFAGKGEP